MREPTRTEECQLILGALADLTAAHAVLLKTMEGQERWSLAGVTEARGDGSTTTLVLASLVARGLVDHSAVGGGYSGTASVYSVTQLGVLILNVLDAYVDVERRV